MCNSVPEGNKVLVIEMLFWHDECLFSVCSLLKANGYSVVLYADKRLLSKQADFLSVIDEFKYFDFHKGFTTIKSLFQVRKLIKKQGFDKIYFNTAQGSPIWNFFLFHFPKKIKFVGTLHNVEKLKSSFGQKIISRRIDRYILLSEILLPAYNEFINKPVSVLYSILYPEKSIVFIPKPKDEIWVVILGSLCYSRRDYSFLFTACVNSTYDPRIKFIFLGNKNKFDGEQIFNEMKNSNLQNNFIFFDYFVDDVTFQSYIREADYILPLVHPDISDLRKYISTKISGTYNLAYAFKKPMLCEQSLCVFDEFVDCSYFYTRNNFVEVINLLVNDFNSKKVLYTSSKFSFENQVKVFSNLFV